MGGGALALRFLGAALAIAIAAAACGGCAVRCSLCRSFPCAMRAFSLPRQCFYTSRRLSFSVCLWLDVQHRLQAMQASFAALRQVFRLQLKSVYVRPQIVLVPAQWRSCRHRELCNRSARLGSVRARTANSVPPQRAVSRRSSPEVRSRIVNSAGLCADAKTKKKQRVAKAGC